MGGRASQYKQQGSFLDGIDTAKMPMGKVTVHYGFALSWRRMLTQLTDGCIHSFFHSERMLDRLSRPN